MFGAARVAAATRRDEPGKSKPLMTSIKSSATPGRWSRRARVFDFGTAEVYYGADHSFRLPVNIKSVSTVQLWL